MKSIATLMAVYHGDDPAAFAVSLDSILNQQFHEAIESRLYLAVDGAVSAEINQVITDRAHRIFFIHRLSESHGLASALNSLIRQLGDEQFVFRMDADDRSFAWRYQSQLDYFSLHPDIDILGTDITEIDRENGSRRLISFCRGHKDALAKLCARVPVAHPTVCFRRHVLDQIGGYPMSGSNEDIALWFRCAKAGFRFDNVRVALLEFNLSPHFWHRRGVRKSFNELCCYMKGIWMLEGLTWKYVFPLLRFCLRSSPRWVSQLAYRSSVRRNSTS